MKAISSAMDVKYEFGLVGMSFMKILKEFGDDWNPCGTTAKIV